MFLYCLPNNRIHRSNKLLWNNNTNRYLKDRTINILNYIIILKEVSLKNRDNNNKNIKNLKFLNNNSLKISHNNNNSYSNNNNRLKDLKDTQLKIQMKKNIINRNTCKINIQMIRDTLKFTKTKKEITN